MMMMVVTVVVGMIVVVRMRVCHQSVDKYSYLLGHDSKANTKSS